MVRTVIGIFAGIAAALATVMLVEAIGHQIYPLPSDLNLRDTDQMRALFEAMPLGAQAFVVAAWFLAALVGGLVAKILARVDWTVWVTAGLVALAGIANIMMIPHPVWMQLAAVIAPLLGGFLALHLVRRPDRSTPSSGSFSE